MVANAPVVGEKVNYFTVGQPFLQLRFDQHAGNSSGQIYQPLEKTMKKIIPIVALLALPAVAQANLVVNGSFEDYTSVNAGTWSIFGSGHGWTTGNNGVEIRNAVAGSAEDGVRFAELDTTGNSWISQTIHTNANQLMELSFSYAPRAGVSAASNKIHAFWNNQSLGIFTGNGNTTTSWIDVTFDVQADASGFGVLKFAAIGTSDGYGGSLDNVSLNAVPEPESAALMFAGLGLLAAVSRRRQNRA